MCLVVCVVIMVGISSLPHEVGVGITVVRIFIDLTSYIPTRFEKLSCNRELRLECSCCS